MNKTRKRAIEKHRAKHAKIEVRRKAMGDQTGGKPRMSTAPAPPPGPARSKSAARRQAAAEAAE